MTRGELWVSEELLALRSAGFRPRAWARFLRRSLDRASETRRAHPRLARQARFWSGAGLVGGLAAAGAARRAGASAPRRGPWIAWCLASATMLDWHLGMLEGPHGEPHARLRAADALTLARLGFVPFVAATSGNSRRDRDAFSALVAAGALTDLLDGRFARCTGTTRLGRDLDTAADVLLKLAAARTGRQAGWLATTPARLLAACQIIGIAAATMSYFRTGRRRAAASFGHARWSAPALLGGLAVAPRAPRCGNALVAAASLVTVWKRRAGREDVESQSHNQGATPCPLRHF